MFTNLKSWLFHSNSFCFCIPVRAGFVLISVFTFLLSGAISIIIWFEIFRVSLSYAGITALPKYPRFLPALHKRTRGLLSNRNRGKYPVSRLYDRVRVPHNVPFHAQALISL